MNEETTFANKVLQFNNKISKVTLDLPSGFRIINPYNGDSKKQVEEITKAFYKIFYNDNNKRRMILGSSPARRGTAVTGVPYEDAHHLQKVTGILLDDYYINKSSANFLYEVMEEYGGCEKFYSDFYMNFVCPLGIVRTNEKGNDVNCNYYENKQLQKMLYSFIINSIKEQLNEMNIDNSICYCIGSGENYKFLSKINEEYNFFQTIIPLEHPRFITQYNSNQKNIFFDKYLDALRTESQKGKGERCKI